MKNLVIVESPTKARTIGKFLGSDYTIKYSMGHIIDLPKSTLAVDIDNNFNPLYEVIPDKKPLIADLRRDAKSADTIILATDPDREGEAIASNIRDILSSSEKLNIKNEKFKRIVFHEITEEAIKEALENPRDVDNNLVSAQTARRVLDRLVGYRLSPLLWQKVRRGLSAGRVQSVALRLIVEREREIARFEKEDYWTIHVVLEKSAKEKAEFALVEINGEKIETQQKHELYDGTYTITKTSLNSEEKAKQIISDIATKQFIVSDVLEKETKRSPFAPFTTSTLQQEASRRFGYAGKRSMSLAQKLYEEGFITYHRTDSTMLSSIAIGQIRKFIQQAYGDQYIPAEQRIYLTKQKSAQEAHEGIRPTKFNKQEQQNVEDSLGRDCARLYEIIWKRAVASQMADAIIESTSVIVDSQGKNEGENNYTLKANGSVLIFDGFLKVNPLALQDNKLPKFAVADALKVKDSRWEKHETPPPPRYNDASLIGALEEKGIGRPSTYASIISTLVDRVYIERIEKRFEPTTVGIAVNDFLVSNFSDIDDIPFTAHMEDELDNIANGQKEWVSMMRDFYLPFEKKLIKVKEAPRVKIAAEETDESCPQCGSKLIVRLGRFGKFLACSKFPECKFTKPFVQETNLTCPKDGGKVIIKKTRKGRKFFGCSNYPNCDFAAWKMEDIIKNTKVPVSPRLQGTNKMQNLKV